MKVKIREMKRVWRKNFNPKINQRKNEIPMQNYQEEVYEGTKTVSHFLIHENEYEVDPRYQREEVWSKDMKQHFIDSLIRGLKTQKVYVNRHEDGTKYIVDGQQRLKAIWDFRNGNFPLSEEYSGELGGKKYSELTDEEKERFDNATITLVTLRNFSDEEVREIFRRINRGKPLNPAERLNAYPGKIVPLMRRLSEHPFFTNIITLHRRRYRHYLTSARFMLIEFEGLEDISPEHVRDFFRKNKDVNEDTDEIKKVKRVLNFLEETFDADTKELQREAWIVTLYSVTSELLDKYVMDGRKEDLKDFFTNFYQKIRKVEEGEIEEKELAKFHDAVSRGTTSKKKIRIRHEVMLRKFLRYCEDLLPKDEERLFSEEERIAVYRDRGGKCEICGKEISMSNFHVHHQKPHSEGGKTTLTNAVLICPECHSEQH